jgi:hypothetical protein
MCANELMMWGLTKLWDEGKEGGYAVKHGSKPVRDFPVRVPQEDQREVIEADEIPNFFEKAYPCLFPWGRGGIEAPRPVHVDFREHVNWALQHVDHRFRRHETFSFHAFGILQRRQALNSARIQMRRSDFEKDVGLMKTLTLEKLQQAESEETRKVPISDEAVRKLKRHLHGAAGRVLGSDESRYRLRSQIWSTSVCLGPPSLWITINPSDIHDPVAQFMAGSDINLDNFANTAGPNAKTRAQNIAEDPFAASKFFHYIIKTILETLFQIKEANYRSNGCIGILGEVNAYFATVECQGRGTLHLHLLGWLKHAPTPDEMTSLLHTEDFRQRLKIYIDRNIRAYVPGLESAESVEEIPLEKEISYNLPIDPDLPDYEVRLRDFELKLARAEQVHVCKARRCLTYDDTGAARCKRRAPFPLSDENFVSEGGECGPKRLYGYMNGWNPGILVNARCNNDCKFLTNGQDTKNISFYITAYSAKNQKKTHNLSAIMAKSYAYHHAHPNKQYEKDLRENQRLLLFRVMDGINREQEIAAPMVMSYLTGDGDVYRSHTYSMIHWSSFVRDLKLVHRELRRDQG